MLKPGRNDDDLVRLLERRGEFLRCLESSPRQKPDVVEALDWSRSTVDRALRELEQAGFVERTGEGYATTLAGQLAARTYDEFVERVDNILVASPLIETFPRDSSVSIPLEAFAGVERVSAGDHTSFEVPSVLRSAIESAHQLTVLMPVRADPLLLGLCQSRVVEGDLDLDLIIGPDLHETLQQRFPGTLGELVEHGQLMRAERSPPCSLFLVERLSGDNEAIAIAYDGDIRSGIFRNDTAVALESAREYVNSVTEAATAVSDATITASEAGSESETASERGTQRRLPTARPPCSARDEQAILEQEGFIELTDDYFDSRSPGSPTTSWRTGIDFVEIAAGHAVERTYERDGDGDRQSIVEDLLDGLRGGRDHALVGLPGSGKSTVCKQVAYRWYTADHGTVLYREDGTGQTFDSTAALRARLRECDGHTLVVIENALTPEANAVFRVMASYRDDPTVTFLLESREHEWDDPSAVSSELDAPFDTYRTELIERVRMPPLDATECERLISHFETVTERRVDLDASDLLDGHGNGQDSDPAALLVVLHRLALSADPLASFRAMTSTTLTEDVLRTYDDLRAIGDRALDVGVLVSVLNAADIGVHPGYVYALTADCYNHDHDHSHVDEEIDDALALLKGRVIFDHPEFGSDSRVSPDSDPSSDPDSAVDSEGGNRRYRSVHESWSVLFLQQLHDRAHENGATQAQERFGRVVTALLSLADDEIRRVRIGWEFAGTSPAIKEVSSDPQEWADETIERLFSLGLSHSSLVPLFGVGDSQIDLPEACSSDMEIRCTEWRGKMSLRAGNLDDAASEFEQFATLVDDPPAELWDEADTLRARSLKHQGTVAFRRSNFDAAESFYKRSRSSYRMADNEQGELDAINNLGIVAWSRGDLDEATTYLQRCLDRYRELGNHSAETDAQFNLAAVLDSKSDLATAAEHYQSCLDQYRSTGDRRSEADTLNNLGVLKRKRADLDGAERCLAQALDTYRDVGDVVGEANSLHSLGHVAQLRGAFDRAVEFHERSLERYHEVGDTQGVAQCLNDRGTIDRWRGDLDAARRRYEHSNDLRRDIGDQLGVAECLVNLGRVARLDGDLATAVDRAERSLDRYQERGDVRGEATSLRLLGAIDRDENRFGSADDRLSASLERTRESGDRLGEARTLLQQGVLAAEQQNFKPARNRFETALSLFCDIGARPDAVDTCHHLANVATELGETETASEYRETAAELADEIDY